jgi:predicted HTH transcriptional regulator
MSFVLKYFGKEIENLTYQDVVDFFSTEKEESDKIEFKSYVAGGDEKDKENGIIRSVCAFLNSIGGVVVWGAPVGQSVPGKTEKVFTGALSPLNKLIEKDYFINRLTDLITPAPNGITFTRLENARQYVYILNIEPSEYSPHQFRNTYYMRIDGQTKPAPHHYIEALFKKITYPHLKGFIKIEEIKNDGRQFFLRVSFIIFNMSKLQNEHS